MASLTGSATRFVRDRLTWLGYISLAAYAFYVYALGPMVNLLRQELHLTYTVSSLHSTLWSVGGFTGGLTLNLLVRRLGRHRLLWLAAAGTVVGAALFIAGHTTWVTLTAALVLGAGSTLLGASSSVTLADHHPQHRDRALVEANMGASAVGVAAPALLGLLAVTAAGWRAALGLPVLALAALFLVLGRVPLPRPASVARHPGRLPRAFWPPCVLVALAVAIEFAVLFYGIPLLGIGTRLSTSAATALLSLFVTGELSGRMVGSWLTRRPGRAEAVIAVALLVALAGFLVLWLGRDMPLQAVALFVTGLGVGNLYPLTLSLALGAGAGRTDQAMSRTQVGISIAIGTAPLLLGVLADHVGVLKAVSVEPVMILAALVILLASRAGRSEAAATVPASG